uniref:Atos homolog protein B n=1 Tax=Oryzias sinensis TaxID=183150 RepID=A0A8C7ZXA1_9TELE
MRHIHVELAHKKAPLELPAQEGDLPPTAAPTDGLDPGVRAGALRHFGQEELRLQKVYQLSIFSQMGGFSTSAGSYSDSQQRQQRKRGVEEPPLTHKHLHLDDPIDGPVLQGGVLCGSAPALGIGMGLATKPGEPGSPYSYMQLESEGGAVSQISTPLPDPAHDGYTTGSSGGQPTPHLYEMPTYESPNPASPTSPPGPFSPPHHTELQEPGLATEWDAGLESSPPERSATHTATSNGLASWEKTPCSNGHRLFSGGHIAAKKRLLSPSETNDSCSEDEGPSTSKRSRLLLLTSGPGPASCRSTDAKAAPYWNHLLPTARDMPKVRNLTYFSSHYTFSESLRIFLMSIIVEKMLTFLSERQESMLKGRFSPAGQIEGFTAEIGASGSYCPQHVTLPVQVTYYDISEHSAPSPFLGVISLEPLGKKGYSIPKAGTIQVTLFNPNKTVVKMFLVTYNFSDMPVNHITFLRHRIFLVPVEESAETTPSGGVQDRKKILCYLIHLRFQSSKSGKIYLHNDIRLLFSRKSIEVDTGIPYELKSFTEVPKNPEYSPRE